jgi:hypothetical protein
MIINWKKNQSKINLVIDGIMLILLAVMAGLGFLIKYVLVPGFKRNALYGSDVELYFWGLDRHQWGSIHLYISFAFLFLLLLHIILHWKMIVCIFRKMIRRRMPRTAVAVCLGVISLFFIVAPFLVSPDIAPLQTRNIHSRNAGRFWNDGLAEVHDSLPLVYEEPPDESPHESHTGHRREHSYSNLEIYGSMTLDELCRRHSVSVNELTGKMDIPASESAERIGRLKRRYGFEMDELKNTIVEIRNHN